MVQPFFHIHARKSPMAIPPMSHTMSCQDATRPCSLSHSSLPMPIRSVIPPAIAHGKMSDIAMAMRAEVSRWRSPSVLIQSRMLPFIDEMIEDATET